MQVTLVEMIRIRNTMHRLRPGGWVMYFRLLEELIEAACLINKQTPR